MVHPSGGVLRSVSSSPSNKAPPSLPPRLSSPIQPKKTKTIGAGRTDAGVHALGQVFHFDAQWRHGSDKLLNALRVRLPEDIQPLELVEVPSSFHALCSAKGKYYVYQAVEGHALPLEMRYVHSLKNRTLDVAFMRKGADHLRRAQQHF